MKEISAHLRRCCPTTVVSPPKLGALPTETCGSCAARVTATLGRASLRLALVRIAVCHTIGLCWLPIVASLLSVPLLNRNICETRLHSREADGLHANPGQLVSSSFTIVATTPATTFYPDIKKSSASMSGLNNTLARHLVRTCEAPIELVPQSVPLRMCLGQGT